MEQTDQLYYKRRKEIDVIKWDNCVDNATNGSIYAYSFYLDHMADNWDALILNDYEAVMPLTWRKKFGIHYLYQPFLAPHLGLIGKNISKDLLERFLMAIPKKFSFWEINLNEENVFDKLKLQFQKKNNYRLSLDQPYEEIRRNYNQNLKRNIKKASTAGCVYRDDISTGEIYYPAIEQFNRYANFSAKDSRKFKTLAEKLWVQGEAEAVAVFQNGILMAACIFLLGHNTAYYILAMTTSKGKQTGASHFLLDQFIQKKCGKISTLNFAGSDIASVARFYESFGANQSYYSSLRVNRLHPLLRWLKR